MRFLVLVKANEQSEAGELPSAEMLAKMGAFNEQLVKAGMLLEAEGLQPTSKGSRIRYSSAGQRVIDGPFTETKELVAGFWLLQARSKAEVIEWLLRCPFEEGAEVEIRQLFEAEDFAPVLSPKNE